MVARQEEWRRGLGPGGLLGACARRSKAASTTTGQAIECQAAYRRQAFSAPSRDAIVDSSGCDSRTCGSHAGYGRPRRLCRCACAQKGRERSGTAPLLART